MRGKEDRNERKGSKGGGGLREGRKQGGAEAAGREGSKGGKWEDGREMRKQKKRGNLEGG